MAILSQHLTAGVVYLYDLGHAHSRYTYSTFEEFAIAVSKLASGVNSVCYTNQNQTIERGWLTEIGYSSVGIGGRMCFHTLSAEKSAMVFKEIEEAVSKAEEERNLAYKRKYDAFVHQAQTEGRKDPFTDIRVGDHVFPKTHILKDKHINPEYKDSSTREVVKIEGGRLWLRSITSWDYDGGYDINRYSRFLPK